MKIKLKNCFIFPVVMAILLMWPVLTFAIPGIHGIASAGMFIINIYFLLLLISQTLLLWIYCKGQNYWYIIAAYALFYLNWRWLMIRDFLETSIFLILFFFYASLTLLSFSAPFYFFFSKKVVSNQIFSHFFLMLATFLVFLLILFSAWESELITDWKTKNLWKAIAHFQNSKAKFWIIFNADIKKEQYSDFDQNTKMDSLAYSAAVGNDDVLKLIFEQGVTDDQVNNALIAAVKWKQIASIHFLFDRAKTPIKMSAVNAAIVFGNTELATTLLNSSKIDINSNDFFGRSPLIKAAENGYLDLIKTLISKGVGVNRKNLDGETALCSAVKAGYREIVEILIKSGADVNASCGDYSQTPLFRVVNSGDNIIGELLINNGADVNAQEMGYGNTVLHEAVQNENRELVKLLLAKNANVNLQNMRGETALHMALKKNNIAIVRDLVSNKADVNKINDNGVTPLYFAVQNDNIDLVKLLISHGALVNNKDLYGWAPIQYAKSQAMKKLLNKE